LTIGIAPHRGKPRWLAALGIVVVVGGLFGNGVAFAAKSTAVSFVDYAQCADGTADDAAKDCPGGWLNGILQASNSTYHEDEVTPQRAELLVPTGAALGGHTVTFSYQTRKGAAAVHAYDSLATYNYTQTDADRTQGLNPPDVVGGTAKSALIPSDTTAVAPISGSLTSSTADHQLSDANRQLQAYGLGASGTLSVSTPVHDCAIAVPTYCGDATKDDFASITVTYSVTAVPAKVQFLFGGHMAPSGGARSWGTGNGASNINGGPYHIKWVAADGASIGNRDNQIMGSAILPLSVTLTTTLHQTNSSGVDVSPSNNGTSITINLPANGSGVYVTDVVSASDSSATGTVAFKYYSLLADCTADTSGTGAGSGIALTSGSAASTPTLFTTTGTFYWRAFLTGSGNTLDASSACNEVLTVRQNTSTATTLHQTDATGADVSPSNNAAKITVAIGSYVKDVASLTPSGSTGTVAFTYYPTLDDCTNGTNGVPAGGGTVTSGTASSDPKQFNSAGTFYWQAVFTGSGAFNNSSSACGDETVTVNKASPTLASAPRLYPQDYATLSGILSGGVGQLTVKFELFDPSDPNCTGTAAFTQTVNVSGDNTYNTTNSTYWLSSSSATGIYKWKVTFNGNTFNNGNSKACGLEQFDFEGITDAAAS
jgi:hypothetical protein